MNIEPKFDKDDPSKKLVLLMEEVGELARALRGRIGLKFSDTTRKTDLVEELADVQIVLLGLASLLEVDMDDAMVAKEAKNRNRIWR
jgi:NTP pyrophosphatase (non-canonical NTP hydrolase)